MAFGRVAGSSIGSRLGNGFCGIRSVKMGMSEGENKEMGWGVGRPFNYIYFSHRFMV
jgi:hypothetical protein